MLKDRRQVKTGDKIFYIIDNEVFFGTVTSAATAKREWKNKLESPAAKHQFEKDLKKITNIYAYWNETPDYDDGLPRFVEADLNKVYLDTPASRTLYLEKKDNG